ncbi:MAG: hypothetical protein M1818_007382 [Claussenomyces sp. TS43310]|nr:MAG: hypothetical protein M1818_007382 [Claussenomyces sp. TS43310]
MFSRRRRAASNPPVNNVQAPSASAMTAATSAFLNHRSSQASLAAAAAGTALRSRPTTPISVGEVQTKRMLRRTTSNSSAGSAPDSVRDGPTSQLERRGSSSSMTERSFRDPSPHRGLSSPNLDDAPPVPAIPKHIKPAITSKSHRRAASAEAPPMRVTSPTPNRVTGRGSSLGPNGGQQKQQPQPRSAQRVTSLSSVQELTNLDRPESRGSVNFSYPAGARAMSPYGQQKLTNLHQSVNERLVNEQKPDLVYDANTRTFVTEAELLFQQQMVEDAAERPVKTKTKKMATHAAPGTHLAAGTIGGRPKGTAVDALEAAGRAAARSLEPRQPSPARLSATSPIATTPPARLAEPKASGLVTTPSSAESSALTDTDSDASERSQFQTRAGMLLAKKPSVIAEQDEGDSAEAGEEIDTRKVLGRQAALRRLESGNSMDRGVSPSPLPRSTAGRGHGRVADAALVTSIEQQQSPPTGQPPPRGINESAQSAVTSGETLGIDTNGRSNGNVRGSRVQSPSPARIAHFSSSPENGNLSVKHDPPARSISPRKSALKHSPSPRGPSPIGDAPGAFSKGHSSALSEVSDTSTNLSEDRAPPRKKTVRVSFDDDSNVILGQAAPVVQTDSPVVASPQNKKSWFSRGKKQDQTVFDADDEVMKPRPALPAFGSVREKKSREVEDRPLVKPSQPKESTPPHSPVSTTTAGETTESPLGQSVDHGIGAVLAQDHNTRNEANISKSREPLPPEVTSVEGSGYISDSSSSGYDIDSTEATTAQVDNAKYPAIDHHLEPSTLLSFPPSEDTHERPSPKTNGSVPLLALTQATPTLEDQKEFPDMSERMPGGFPGSASDSGLESNRNGIVSYHATDPTPADLGIAEPEPSSHSPIIGSIAVDNFSHPPIMEESDETDRDSIYSDAAEDLSDLEGDGFMSLDAVVESPVVPASLPPVINSAQPESPTVRAAMEKVFPQSQPSRKTSEPDLGEGWDKAQEYWASLTPQRKKELEKQARGDDGVVSPEPQPEVVPIKAASKPKTRKKVIVAPPVEKSSVIEDLKPRRDANRTYQIAPGAKAGPNGNPQNLRSSMRAALPDPVDEANMRRTMRNTMRNGGAGQGGSMGGSTRGQTQALAPPAEARASSQKNYRPMSCPPPEMHAATAAARSHARNVSVGAVAAAPIRTPVQSTPPSLRRTGSDASDSSFQRARPSGDGYSMRTSMRSPGPQKDRRRPQSSDASASQLRSSRFSLRSLSPTGSTSRRPFSSSGAPTASPPVSLGRTMRNRSYSDDSTPTLRNPDRAKSTLSGFGFGRSKPAPKASAPVRSAPKRPGRISRFADSSDEDDAQPTYRSRFVDSSDDEDDVPARAPPHRTTTALHSTPVRSFPQRNGVIDNGDSSDLPDSDEERVNTRATQARIAPTSPASIAGTTLGRSGSGREFIGSSTTTTSFSAGPTLRQEQKSKGGFMSILRRKKPDDASRVRKSTLDSAARRDTPLERSRPELDAMRRQDSTFSMASEGRPRLQKRPAGSYGSPTMSTMPSDWPLGGDRSFSGTMRDDQGRPMTSDGVVRGGTASGLTRPTGSRRVTSGGFSDMDVMEGSPLKKKKKFGMLRKAFGLDL